MLRRLLIRLGRLLEHGLEQIGRRSSPPVLEPYLGYEARDGWHLRARVLTHLRRAEPLPEQSRWTNLKQMLSLFITDEVAGVPVEAAGQQGCSDDEGYVAMKVPPRDTQGPWAEVAARVVGQKERSAALLPVRRIGPARYLVISDIDDTMIETGAHSLARNLWTTFTGSALTRRVHPDALRLVSRLADGDCNPVYYVSSSPWNLHAFLEGIFVGQGLPRGPMFLRDLGLSDKGTIGETHLGHKGGAIQMLMTQIPDLPVYLLGDSGQKDATIYRTIVEWNPHRVLGVALREPAPGVGTNDAEEFARIEAAGVPCFHGPSFDAAAGVLGLDAPRAEPAGRARHPQAV